MTDFYDFLTEGVLTQEDFDSILDELIDNQDTYTYQT